MDISFISLQIFCWIIHFSPFFVSSGHYGKENLRSGGQDMHNFISSGFVTLGRGHLKGKVDPHYLFFHITVPLKTKFRIIIILFTKLLCHAVILLLPNECAVKNHIMWLWLLFQLSGSWTLQYIKAWSDILPHTHLLSMIKSTLPMTK